MSLSKQSITSDKDYLKILVDDSITISANAAPDADSTFPSDPVAPLGFANYALVGHGLGTVPLVRAFWDPDKNGTWYSAANFDAAGVRKDPWLKIINGTNILKLIMNTDGGAKTDIPVFYRIYDLGSVAVNSDSRIDKIFYVEDQVSGVVPLAANSLITSETILPIPHNQTSTPIWVMQFSEDGSNWYEEGTPIVGGPDTSTGPPGGPYARYYFTVAFCTMDGTNLNIHLRSNYATAKTIYARFVMDYRS